MQDIVSKCADDRQLYKILEYFFAVSWETSRFRHIFRIDHHEAAEVPRLCVACQENQGGRLAAGDNIGLCSNHVFDKIVDELNIKVACISDPGFIGTAASKEVHGIDGM